MWLINILFQPIMLSYCNVVVISIVLLSPLFVNQYKNRLNLLLYLTNFEEKHMPLCIMD